MPKASNVVSKARYVLGEGAITSHKVNHILVRLDEDHLDVLGVTLFQLLLEITAPMLILAEAQNLALKVLQFDVCKASILYDDCQQS